MWACYDDDIVTVDANGRITARGHGKATVSVYSVAENGLADACTVTVLEDENSLEIHPASALLAPGETRSSR